MTEPTQEMLAASKRKIAELQPEIQSAARGFYSMLTLESGVTLDDDEQCYHDAGVMMGMAAMFDVLARRGWIRIPDEDMPR